MTTLISWVACDSVKQTAIYLASDSRLSWNKDVYWDQGRKIFPSQKYADIFGYCGEAVFCSQQLSQIVTYIDSCKTFENLSDPTKRFEIIYDLIRSSFGHYPKTLSIPSFSIVYLTRNKKYDFRAYLISWDLVNGWSSQILSVGNNSSLVISLGSGANLYRELYSEEIVTSDFGSSSRGYFYALNRLINQNRDPLTGGPPQISCLYNIASEKNMGVVFNESRYIYGLEIPPNEHINEVRWVNETLEKCNGKSMSRFSDAQQQPIPNKLLG